MIKNPEFLRAASNTILQAVSSLVKGVQTELTTSSVYAFFSLVVVELGSSLSLYTITRRIKHKIINKTQTSLRHDFIISQRCRCISDNGLSLTTPGITLKICCVLYRRSFLPLVCKLFPLFLLKP